MQDLISIVVPIYRIEKFIGRCVDSIIRQSYVNLEIILVNDGSPDNCGAICDDYAKQDHRVRVIHKENGGLSDARNFGTEAASGEFITYVDGDDWLHRDFIRINHELIETTAADLTICGHLATTEDREDAPIGEVTHTLFEGECKDELLWAQIDQTHRIHRDVVVAWGKLIRREAAQANPFPLGRIHEDNFVTHKYIAEAKRVVYTPLQLLNYYQREESLTAGGFNGMRRLHMIASYKERGGFFRKRGKSEMAAYCARMQFLKCLGVEKQLRDTVDPAGYQQYRSDQADLKYNLRNSHYGFKFRILYESYYVFPKMVNMLIRLKAK